MLETAGSHVPSQNDDVASVGYHVWKQWSVSQFGKPLFAEDAYYRAEILDLVRPQTGARIVEIGFGNGSFLGSAQQAGHAVLGIEINPVLLERAREAGLQTAAGLEELANDAFDAVVALDVLEHIPGPACVLFLANIARVLRPGGIVVLRFPNGDSPFGRANQHGDITHVTSIGSEKLKYFAGRSGLEILALKNPAVPSAHLTGLLSRTRRLLRVGLHRLIESLVCFAFYEERLLGPNRPLATNMIAVLRKPAPAAASQSA